MDIAFVDYLARWGHFLFGITWIGLLYYFNLVQTEYFKEADPAARNDAFVKLVPRALWWFRWGAMFTLLTGLVMLGIRGAGLTADITLGAVIATLMFLNVWLVIWPNQRIVISSNEQIKAGGQALPAAAAAAPKAALASRTNATLSIPMLFLMGSSAHYASGDIASNSVGLIIGLVIVAAVEVNALVGKQGPMTTVRGFIMSGLALTVILVGLLRFL